MSISAGSRKRSLTSRKRERQRKVRQKLSPRRKRNRRRRKQRDKMERFWRPPAFSRLSHVSQFQKLPIRESVASVVGLAPFPLFPRVRSLVLAGERFCSTRTTEIGRAHV